MAGAAAGHRLASCTVSRAFFLLGLHGLMDPTASAADNPVMGKGPAPDATSEDPPLSVPAGERVLYTRVFFRCVVPQEYATKLKEDNGKVVVVGDCASLGHWDHRQGVELFTQEDMFPCFYTVEPVKFQTKVRVSYQYALVSQDGNLFAYIDKDKRSMIPTGGEMTVEDDFGMYRNALHPEDVSSLFDDRSSVEASSQISQTPETNAHILFEQRMAAIRSLESFPPLESNNGVLMVSFELPVKVEKVNGEWVARVSESGNVMPSMYQLRHQYPVRVMFVGWPGVHVKDYTEQREIRELLLDYDCIPVFLAEDLYHNFVNFCDRFLWPIFHSVVMSFVYDDNPRPFDLQQWAAYQTVNQKFSEVVWTSCREDQDMVWIHDIYLLLMPMLVGRKLRTANVGLFLHTPFPSSDLYKCLPVREELLKGMLCADLVGFQFFEYERHFLTCCKRILGLDYHFKKGGFVSVDYLGREVALRVGHACIHYDYTMQKMQDPLVIERARALRTHYGDNVIVYASVDRCDRLSGIGLKFRAWRLFLEQHPNVVGRAVLRQHAYVPKTHSTKLAYKLACELTDIAASINKQFGSEVIHFESGPLSVVDRMALLRVADVLLDTSVKSGLNLVPFEYYVARAALPPTSPTNLRGAVMCSEFSGCSRVLIGSLSVNPWNTDKLVLAIQDAKHMLGTPELAERLYRDTAYVSSHSLLSWAEDFLCDLRRARKKAEMMYITYGFGANFRLMGLSEDFQRLEHEEILAAYKRAKFRVLFLDNEGSCLICGVASSGQFPSSSSEGELTNLHMHGSPPSETVLQMLRVMCRDPRNVVVILSGRSPDHLEKWFSSVDHIGLAAEHGYYYQVPALNGPDHQQGVSSSRRHWECLLSDSYASERDDTSWKAIAMELMKQYVARTQGSYIEYKGSALVWQYGDADPDFGQWQAKELANSLEELLDTYNVEVVCGKGFVEIKLKGVNKGVAAQIILQKLSSIRGQPDFVLAMGDDQSDELMFEKLKNLYEPKSSPIPVHVESPKHRPPSPAGSAGNTSSIERPKRTLGLNSGSIHRDLNQLGTGVRRPPFSTTPSSKGAQAATWKEDGGNLGLLASHGTSTRRPQGEASTQHAKSITEVFTVSVGKKPSHAKWFVADPHEVSDVLASLATASSSAACAGYEVLSSNTCPAWGRQLNTCSVGRAAGALAGPAYGQQYEGNPDSYMFSYDENLEEQELLMTHGDSGEESGEDDEMAELRQYLY
ncbi:trehalose-6-phosphate synthase, putative [Perkinsus marinus ATCC 50983]|uniref:Trehalose-6-phosphate synthase, putative n=1 Tax=Perkinsus marinus (strain ATCC 50983 / TXsc) TaxID=423536 RepID=C5KBF6_PERM5|nr:trehalose-6-phosphate synthase, putative [Perkinsus marinus ATCC 50983]EER18482.1 trehalose-6-phosphate synthase, putative [Perkinsus marinus ATCC 50983]|eukprot:XP_002786686.1 trehalose-6-phosphate synthase, putative [Perkinsus marinus ATCC 50983]